MIVLVGFVVLFCGGGVVKDQLNIEKIVEVKWLVFFSGLIMEVFFVLDVEKEFVVIDVISMYFVEVEKLINFGYVCGVMVESIIGMKLMYVLVFEDELNLQLKGQLEKVGIEVIMFKYDYLVEGVKKMIIDIVVWFGKKDEVKVLIVKIDNDFVLVKKFVKVLKVLFVYVCGVGMMMVVGDNM